MTTEQIIEIKKKYDEFFGDGYWEREYKQHIVEFIKQCCDEIHAKQKEEMKGVVQLLKVARRPDCDGSGGYAVANPKTGEPELQQCRWCYERNQLIKQQEGI